MSAEDVWRNWEQLLEPREVDDSDSDHEGNEHNAHPDLDDTVAYGEDIDENIEENIDAIMAQGGVDIAALLQQLTQANIDLQQRNVAIDQRAVDAAADRTREDRVRVQVQKMDRCTGDDKPKLRRWIRDLNAFDANHPAASIAVAERTCRENLADTVEAFLADPVNAPRAGIMWPGLCANIENLLLGEAYGEVLRSEHRVMVQKTHESTGEYSTLGEVGVP